MPSVKEWLASLGLSEYADRFAEHRIDFSILQDLTDKDLKEELGIVPLGDRLEQGAKYIDLLHLERGEFVATAGMVADEDHYYVPKNHTDYVIWNRLRQLSNRARSDGPETQGG